MNNIATHKSPAWGPKSNFIIRADLTSFGMPGRIEQIWARKVDSQIFEICCIPFFTYGFALGDTVESNAEYTIQSIVKKEGHRTLRAAIAVEDGATTLHEILHEWVEKTELAYEWYSPGYLAVDLPPPASIDTSMIDHLIKNESISIEIDG